MSEFGKRNCRPSAIRRLKDFLFQERTPNRENLCSPGISTEYGLSASFEKIIDEKKLNAKNYESDKENYNSSDQARTSVLYEKGSMENETIATVYKSFDDTTFIEAADDFDSDEECFEDLERMCDKTLSDPNNTIHTYLAQRKLNKFMLKQQQRTHVGDQIQLLTEVEAPSYLWETTITEEASILEISETKSTLESEETVEKENLIDLSVCEAELEVKSTPKANEKFDDESALTKIRRDTFFVTPRCKKQSIAENLINQFDLIDLESSEHSNPIENAENTIVLLSDDEEDDENAEPHNTAFSIDLDESTNDESRKEFDNTFEEVDYIMRKGVQYLAENNMLPQSLQMPKHQSCSPSPSSSPQTPNTVVKKAAASMKLAPLDTKIKQETFKKPLTSITRIPQCKTLAIKRHHFEHIISPVGAYIKNTPKTPITAEFKATSNVFHSKASRGLDYDTKTDTAKKAEAGVTLSLPKKAYISSEVKAVVDQRRPVTIPGGEKLHKYLQSSIVPSVIRHEGKIKLNTGTNQPPKNVADRYADRSLADLSTVSGDVSLHVLKDAKPCFNK